MNVDFRTDEEKKKDEEQAKIQEPKPGDTKVDRSGKLYRYQSDMSLRLIPDQIWDFKTNSAMRVIPREKKKKGRKG